LRGPPTLRASIQSAPSVNRAQSTVMVRLADGELAGRVSQEFAERLLFSGAAAPVGKVRLRYVRLQPGFVIAKSCYGWALIEEERRKHGDNPVRRGVTALDRRPLKWQAPK
jgi:hypothetical protein